MADLETTRTFIAKRRAVAQRQAWEFTVTRPTPTTAESNAAAAGIIVMQKQWDLSPVDPSSFDPTEPPGRPA
jgi:hypothetical protein